MVTRKAPTIDPITYWAGTNLYRYCGNGPTNATDPSGLWDTAGVVKILEDTSPGTLESIQALHVKIIRTDSLRAQSQQRTPNGRWIDAASAPKIVDGLADWLANPPIIYLREGSRLNNCQMAGVIVHEMTHITKGFNEVPAYTAQIQFLNARLQQYINGGTPVPPELQAAIESLAPLGEITYQANGTPSSFTARSAEQMQNALSRLPVYNPTMRSRIIPGSSRVNVTPRFFISGGGQ